MATMRDDWNDALRTLRLEAGGPAHDTPVGACWYCRRLVDREREAWQWIAGAAELMAHHDCETLWMDSPIGQRPRREDVEDPAEYFEELEDYRRTLVRGHFRTEPRLQGALNLLLERELQRTTAALLEPANPWRRAGENDAEYLSRVEREPDDDHDDDGDDDDEGA